MLLIQSLALNTLFTRFPSTPIPWIRESLKISWIPLLILVLGMDSVQWASQNWAGQSLADAITIIYFLIMLWGLRPEEKLVAIIFVPFSAVAEYLFSQIFELYLYRLEDVPLYVPFGHAILLGTGLILAESYRSW